MKDRIELINERLSTRNYRLELVDYGARLKGLRVMYRDGLLVNMVFPEDGTQMINKILDDIDNLVVYKAIDK